MGEILYSLFIGGCLVVMGLLMNRLLYKETLRNDAGKGTTRQEG